MSGQDHESTAYRVLDNLVRGDYAAVTEQFDEAMAEGIPEPVLREIWQEVSQALGEFKSRGKARTTSQEGFAVVYVPIVFGSGAAQLQLAFDEADRIAGMHVLTPTA